MVLLSSEEFFPRQYFSGGDVIVSEKSAGSWVNKLLGFFNSTSNFRIIFMLVLMFDVRYLAETAYNIVLSLMGLWALLLMTHRLIVKKCIFRVRYRYIIYLFLACACIPVILHSEMNLMANIVTLFWMTVCFFLFYGSHAEKSNYRLKKEMRLCFDVINFVTTLIMFVSLVLFAIFPKGFMLMGFEFCIIESRFVGVIPNANVTAFYSVISIVFCTFLLRMRRADGTVNIKYRIWYITCIVINSFTLILTDSNASLLFMMVYISFWFFYELFKEFTLKKLYTIILRLAAAFLACVTVVASLFFVRVGVQKTISYMLDARFSQIAVSTTLDANNGDMVLEEPEPEASSGETKKEEKPEEKISLGHENKNIDSGRYTLWRQALRMIERNPVFGIGKDNIPDYGKMYIGGKGIRYTRIGDHQYVNFHNGLLTIAVSYGIVGLSLFLVFAVTVAKAVLKSMFKYKTKSRRDGNVLVLIASFSAAYCVYSMFEVALFVDYTYRVFVFWLVIGLGMSYLFKYRRQDAYSHGIDVNAHDDNSELLYLRKKIMGLKKVKGE